MAKNSRRKRKDLNWASIVGKCGSSFYKDKRWGAREIEEEDRDKYQRNVQGEREKKPSSIQERIQLKPMKIYQGNPLKDLNMMKS